MRSRLALIPGLLLVAIAVWEIAATIAATRAVPGDDAWSRAAAHVRAGHRAGDLIVFAPAWADPVGRLHLGDLISLEQAARMDATRYARIWELSIRGGRAPEVAGLAPVESVEEDGVVVRRYERATPELVTDLVAAGSVAEVAFAPHRCVVLATPPGVTGARVELRGIALGTRLAGYVGIADVFTRRDSREPVELEVLIDGARVATAIAPIDVWVPWTATTTPGTATVTFIARWTADPGARRGPKQVCVAAEAYR